MALDISSGPKAKKSLGQNFLQDPNICRRIVDALKISPEDRVIEIGPGPGALTHHIHAQNPAWFSVLEKDYHWANAHMKHPPAGEPRLNVVLTDALLFPWHGLTDKASGIQSDGSPRGWKIIGNLPYNVASPLMWDILSRATGLTRAVFMIQKEVGDRIIASPGTKQYGALSVWLQSFSKPRREFVVPPHVFKPRPKVDSAVLSFEPRIKQSSCFDAQALSWLLKVCFQQRRKQMQKILKGYLGDFLDIAFERAEVERTIRPEGLSPEQFQVLGNTIKDYIPS